ncbi:MULTISPECIES: MarR family winged helix-turn-helix transcriptional regulator [Desulfobacula]|uniref:Transcriptional regulator, MarR family n=2 Tax=Desulfobacula TaxID=28222 RepID=K0NGW7_DESTT|nr:MULTISPECIES: MarR family winged helix-turn-helix transcriptional regulator [Desulfobacula]CCK79083.1 transcriptional regulator, MarR family [Desulfobacula toluolica Tol2]SDU07335.1 transcriptional regulator, MarR family [Desulfobacula phenolica]
MNQELKKKVINTLMQITRKFAEVETLSIGVTCDVSVSTREAHAIESIGEKKCTNVTEIAKYFGFTKSAASQLVSKLTMQGFVIKKQAGHSNKELQLSLTPLGWQTFEAHARMHSQDLKRILKTFDCVEIDVLIRLNELLDNLNSIMDERLNTK